jgi:D-alanyl-lipoteichoic acid acyltransferase DltB (MBOAT superfamily)
MDLFLYGIFAIYLVCGRVVLSSSWTYRCEAFAVLNLAAVFLAWFSGLNAPLYFSLYLGFVALEYLAIRSLHRATDLRYAIAFFTPILFLIAVRYVPADWFAHLFPPLARKIEANPDFTWSAQFLGISYLAFRTSLLVVEIRNRIVEPPGFFNYLSFAFFLPTLPVGPISPYSLHAEGLGRKWTAPPVLRSLARVLLGAVKFNVFGPLLNQLTYSGLILDGHSHPWTDLPVAAISYYLFLYCNFSGACDIAIGSAALMGIPVAENFDRPFLARNLREFWNRWHITLSQFMRDIVFSPLSRYLIRVFGPRSANHAIAASILVTFLLIGVWHGVGWHYAVFGALCALGVAVNHYYTIFLKSYLGRDAFLKYNASQSIRWVATAATFLYFTASLFFFANDGDDIREILAAIRPSR